MLRQLNKFINSSPQSHEGTNFGQQFAALLSLTSNWAESLDVQLSSLFLAGLAPLGESSTSSLPSSSRLFSANNFSSLVSDQVSPLKASGSLFFSSTEHGTLLSLTLSNLGDSLLHLSGFLSGLAHFHAPLHRFLSHHSSHSHLVLLIFFRCKHRVSFYLAKANVIF